MNFLYKILFLAFLLLGQNLSLMGQEDFSPARDCEQGSCIELLVATADELKFELAQQGCLPELDPSNPVALDDFLQNNLLTESCVRTLGKIEENQQQIEQVLAYIETSLLQTDSCLDQLESILSGSNIEEIEAELDGHLQCSDAMRAAHSAQCADDFKCALAASASTLTGFLGDIFNLQSLGGENCDTTQDSCLVQLATGFVKAVFMFFEGTWDLLKMAGQGAADGLSNIWDWMWGVEDHSSSAQLAAAEASEDESIFSMLVNDFPGTMTKAWEGITESLSVWMKENVFCQEWSGLPYHSECLVPAVGFDCLSCKQKFNGFCGISGIFLSEVVPAFLTGGLITAVKYGAQGARTIAKSIRVSDQALDAVRSSSLSQYATRNYETAARALTNSRLAQASRASLNAAKETLQAVLVRPTSLYYKQATQTLHRLAQNQGVHLVVDGSQRFFAFSGKAIGTGFRALIYPIDNPLTHKAFTLGNRSLESVFTLGNPVAMSGGIRTYLTGNRLRKMEELDQHQLTTEPGQYVYLRSERNDLASEAFTQNYHHVVDELFPELAPNSNLLPRPERGLAYSQVLESASEIPMPGLQNRISRQLQADQARLYPVEEVLANSRLNDELRLEKAFEELGLNPSQMEPARRESLEAGLLAAHRVGDERGVFEYTLGELRLKRQALLDAGFDSDQAEYLIRAGLAGRPPTRTILPAQGHRPSDYLADLVGSSYDSRQQEFLTLYAGSKARPARNFIERAWNRFKKIGEEPDVFPDQLEALHFIDYGHISQELAEVGVLRTRKISDLSLTERYGETPYQNFLDTNRYLREERPDISMETFRRIHREMMKDGVEKVLPEELGAIRGRNIAGNVPESFAVSREVLKNIGDNPYLRFQMKGRTDAGLFHGQVVYPNLNSLEELPEAVRRIENIDPKLAQELRDYYRLKSEIKTHKDDLLKLHENGQSAANLSAKERMQESLRLLEEQHSQITAQVGQYNRRIVDALVKERFSWFQHRRQQLGDLDSASKIDEYVDLVADMQRDLISIHPVINGNGRSTRALMLDHALRKEGLPPATLVDPNLDIYASTDEWRQAVREGVIATHMRQQDLTERVRFGLPIENSLELVTPHMPGQVELPLRLQGSTVERVIDGAEYIDPRVYRELARREFERNPALVTRMKTEPQVVWREIDESVSTIVKENNLYYDHRKFGTQRVEVGVIDEDFIQLYGRSSYHDAELYNFKMRTWYEDGINWRGLANKTADKSEEEILDMFRELNLHMASNKVLAGARGGAGPERIRELALEDFKRYNDSIFDEGLVAMARDHSETGPLYRESFGYSTSKNREVGKAFAMGAMVIAEYGKHQEVQHLLRSRILVGAHKARKDVDLTRLKQVREEFSYGYGRQQEVMGVGAADPDSIRIIQRIDEKGDVILSYLRHPEQPHIILVVAGDTDPHRLPDADRILERIDLGQTARN